MKLPIVGTEPVGMLAFVYTVPMATTSKLDAVILLSWLRSLLFHRLSGAPLMKIPLPLSARIMPNVFSAVRITWLEGENDEMSKEDFKRRRVPIGGALVSVNEDAQCEAGATNAWRVTGTVKRKA